MKKINKTRVYIGDLIATNKEFRPLDKEETLIPLYGRTLLGFVVSVGGESYGVRFGKGLSFTDHLNGKLKNPVGYELKKHEFDVLDD